MSKPVLKCCSIIITIIIIITHFISQRQWKNNTSYWITFKEHGFNIHSHLSTEQTQKQQQVLQYQPDQR